MPGQKGKRDLTKMIVAEETAFWEGPPWAIFLHVNISWGTVGSVVGVGISRCGGPRGLQDESLQDRSPQWTLRRAARRAPGTAVRPAEGREGCV